MEIKRGLMKKLGWIWGCVYMQMAARNCLALKMVGEGSNALVNKVKE